MKSLLAIAFLMCAAAALGQQPAVKIWEPYPTQGSVAGGDVVLFRLENPPYCDPVACNFTVAFDGIAARSTALLTDQYLRVITPAHPSGDAEVTLSLFGSVVAKSIYKYRFAGSREIGAPDTFNYELAVVPLAVGSDKPVEGAYGSRWTTELWISNSGDKDVEVFNGWPDCGSSACRGSRFPFIAAHTSQLVTLPADVSSAGYLFYVQKGGAENIHFSLRARDISRTGENAGTELPVHRRSSLFTTGSSDATLLNVPVEDTSRTSLRVYANSLPSVHIRFFSMTDDRLQGEGDVALGPADGKPYGETHGFPARSLYAQISDVRVAFPQLPAGRYRIEASSSTGGWIWALSTVTNNSTQLITSIASEEPEPFGVMRQ